ncbi:MAG TPA: BON domain-containing protein [Pyrinomonadaceae bacterium]|nr:BON domain-containing protein [Pyrinomonadaceae bacterium]
MRVATKALSISLMLTVFAMLVGCNRGPTDEALTQSVRAKINADPGLATQSISVAAHDGVVTLTGNVNSDPNKGRAEELTKGVDGVKSVTNNLTVRPPLVNATPPPVSPDLRLRTDVMASLTKFGITGVTADVANGEVTLTGTIPRAKLQDALKAANESHPKKVINKLTVK